MTVTSTAHVLIAAGILVAITTTVLSVYHGKPRQPTCAGRRRLSRDDAPA